MKVFKKFSQHYASQKFSTVVVPRKFSSVYSSRTISRHNTSLEFVRNDKELVSPWHHVPLFPHLQQLDCSARNRSKYSVRARAENKSNRDENFSVGILVCSDYEFFDASLEDEFHKICSNRRQTIPTDFDIVRHKMIELINDVQTGVVVNMVVEIPKCRREKMEIMTRSPGNPIKQDRMKNGAPRSYYGPIFWNYGAISQTWESSSPKDVLGLPGDEDPLDLIELGPTALGLGDIVPVKVIGCLAMIDQGELDWKVLGLRVTDPNSSIINSVSDLEILFPKYLSGIREWLRWYKFPESGKLAEFAYDEELLTADKAVNIILESHCDWRKLILDKQSHDFWVPPKVVDEKK